MSYLIAWCLKSECSLEEANIVKEIVKKHTGLEEAEDFCKGFILKLTKAPDYDGLYYLLIKHANNYDLDIINALCEIKKELSSIGISATIYLCAFESAEFLVFP